MRDLYATTMQLVHIGGGDAFDVAADTALRWAWRVAGEPPALREFPRGSEVDSDTRTSVRWWASLGGKTRAIEIQLRHPDSEDPSFTWLATTTVSDVDGSTRATLVLQRGADVHVLRPSSLSLRAPGLVMDLMRTPLRAYAGSLELTDGARTLSAGVVEAYVDDILTHGDRALPVLMASSETPIGLVEAVARAAAGLAQVVRNRGRETDNALNELLHPRRMQVPAGGFRLFWPGFGVAGDHFRHPYWTRAQVREGARPGRRTVVTQVVALLAPISTGRVPTDPAVIRARREALLRDAEQRANRQQRRRAQPKTQDPASTEDYTRRVAELQVKRDEAEKRAEQAEQNELRAIEDALRYDEIAEGLRGRLTELETLNSTLRANLRAVQEYSEAAPEEADVPAAVSNWDELAELLTVLEGPGLVMTQRAMECADGKGRFPYPDVMWRALERLSRVAEGYHERDGQLGRRFEDFALEAGELEVALTDGTYRDCWFEHDGEWHKRLPHVKITDAKAPNEVGRIYFAIDSAHSRLIVDWFGTKPDRPNTRRTG